MSSSSAPGGHLGGSPGGGMAWWLGTVAGVGLSPVAPGTCGSAVAIPIFVLFSPLCHAAGALGLFLFTLSWAALLGLGCWAGDRLEPVFGRADDGRIVLDEVIGQLLTFAPLLFLSPRADLPALVTGFVLFRLFDVWKPGPVRWAERRFRGGLGVMMDDVVAGALAAVILALLVSFVPFLAGGAA